MNTEYGSTGLRKIPRDKVIFLLRQVAITGINALIGFLILRGLPKMEYAVYTIVFSLLAIFTNITNVGITPAMSGIGGKVWDKPGKLRALLNTALELRVHLGAWFALPFAVYCAWQFYEAGSGALSIAALIALLLFAAWVQLQNTLYAIVLQLNKAVGALQRNELWFVVLKLGGAIALLAIQAPVAVVVAWICGCMAYNLWANQRLSASYLERHNETDPRYQKEINTIIRTNFVRTVYWSLEGQISILLCTLFATTESIADIGALGRLSVYFTIFQAFILNYALPGLSKAHDTPAIGVRVKRILAFTVAAILPILIWAFVHPKSLLWLLGPQYGSLKPYLLAYLIAASLGQFAAVVYQMCASKAWIQMNRFYVPLALPLQIGFISLLDMSQIGNVIWFIGANNLFFLLFNLTMFYSAYRRHAGSPVPG